MYIRKSEIILSVCGNLSSNLVNVNMWPKGSSGLNWSTTQYVICLMAGRSDKLKWVDLQILLLLLLPVQEAYLTNHSTKRHETWQTDRVL